MAEEITGNNTEIIVPNGGMYTDCSPIDQPKGTYRYALNAVDETEKGEQNRISSEGSCFATFGDYSPFFPVGHKYIADDTIFIIYADPATQRNHIGIIDKDGVFIPMIRTSVLNITTQCDIVFRLRRGNDRVFYWTDGVNKVRSLNLDQPQDYYNSTYKAYLKSGGDPNNYFGEKWDANSFDLIKSYKTIPTFESARVDLGGNILPGSYNFAIQLVDEDLNPTAWITTSNTINIFNDSLDNEYGTIRGSKNIKSDSQAFEPANKSIHIKVGNLDESFPYYRIAIIAATSMNGSVTEVLLSDLKASSDTVFTYTGNDSQLVKGNLNDILIDREIIYGAKHIEQIENRLVVANGNGRNLPFCDFQKFASRIGSHLEIHEYEHENINDPANPKNPIAPFQYKGYMPGQVYSFGIVYVDKDGYHTPAYHIPAPHFTQDTEILAHTITSNYLDVHDCTTGDYWGSDFMGLNLLNTPVRFHKFPYRFGNDLALVSGGYVNEGGELVQRPFCKIMGIRFSNIQLPHEDIVGYYIVRNEITDDDKVVLDNAIVGPCKKTDKAETDGIQYVTFGAVMPAHQAGETGLSDKISNDTLWFFSPEHKYNNKKPEFSQLIHQGYFIASGAILPSFDANSNVNLVWGIVFNGMYGEDRNVIAGYTTGPYLRGVYINDVQAGTSYNPEFHKKKDKDDDGFDLLIGYSTEGSIYNPVTPAGTTQLIQLPVGIRVNYLDATANVRFQNKVLYNTSVDNRIGFFNCGNTFPISNHYRNDSGTLNRRLLYCAMVRDNQASYSNFMTRPYYKEHNNVKPITGGFGDSGPLFNGDAYIGEFDFISTMFYDMVVANRTKKNKVWKIIVGAVLVVAGAVLSIVGVGVAVAALGVAVLAAAAISLGVSMVMSGIKFEQMKKMIDEDYSKGLIECVEDNAVIATINRNTPLDDDTIRWFSNKYPNLFIESSVHTPLRVGLTSGTTDFINPNYYSSSLFEGTEDEEKFRSYLIEKLTILDKDQGSGRLYKGYASAEVYDSNPDYTRINKEKAFFHLPITYDCCDTDSERFPNRVWWSNQSFTEESIDNYNSFLPNNYKDIEGKHGEITDLYTLGNSLYVVTAEGRYQLPQTVQERITGEIVSHLGTGEFFSIPPNKILDTDLGGAGSNHKWGTIKTEFGVISVNEREGKIQLHSQGVKDISKRGMRNFFKENLKDDLSRDLYTRFGVTYKYKDFPCKRNGIGYLAAYDARHERLLITKKNYSIVPEWISQMFYHPDISSALESGGFGFCAEDHNFYLSGQIVNFDNDQYFENKSFTISYNLNKDYWISFHSYIPDYYMYSQNALYGFKASALAAVWKFNSKQHFRYYFLRQYPFILEIVKVGNPLINTTTEDLIIQTVAEVWDEPTKQYRVNDNVTYTDVLAYNSYQSTGDQYIENKQADTQSPEWYELQIKDDNNSILISRNEKDWTINNIRDNVGNYNVPLFSSYWHDIKSQYPIDKIVNSASIDLDKNWYEKQLLRDKFIIFRLKLNNFVTTKLTHNFTIQSEINSPR